MTVRTADRCASALAILVLSLAAAPAFGLDAIGAIFGNEPIPGSTGLPAGQLAMLNDPHRVYLYFVRSDGYKSFYDGYFQGDTAAANAALRRYADLEKGLEVVLLPGPRDVTSFGGKRKVRADWELYVPDPHGNQFDPKPTLYLYVRHVPPPRPAVPASAAEVERWLKGLDAKAFPDRELAYEELAKQGPAVQNALHKALEGKPSPEARRRIGQLLAKLEGLPGVNLGELVVPAGVRLVGPDELLARHREALQSESVRVRAEVAQAMTRFGPDPAALATLIQMLAGRDAYSRQIAVGVLGEMGKAAAPALPALRKVLDDSVPYVRKDGQAAIAAIEAAKEEPDAAERAAGAKVVREQIGRFVKGRPGN
jgi:hypothetical protein